MGQSKALLIIDMQKCMSRAASDQRNNPLAEKHMVQLLQAARERKIPVVFIRHISRDPLSGFLPGQEGAEFQPAFEPQPSEHVVEKNVPDAFIHSGLERWLRVRDIESLLMVGVSTNNSVESTARTAGNLGFNTYVVADACFAFAKADYAGCARTAQEVHDMSLSNLEGEYAQIISTSAALTWLQS